MMEVIYIFITGMLLLYLGIQDIKTRKVKNLYLLPLLWGAVYFSFLTAPLFLTLLSVALMFVICIILYRLGMGGGDLKIMLILTIMLNIKSFYILAIAGIIYLLFNINKKETRPFVPYIFFGYVMVVNLYFLGVI